MIKRIIMLFVFCIMITSGSYTASYAANPETAATVKFVGSVQNQKSPSPLYAAAEAGSPVKTSQAFSRSVSFEDTAVSPPGPGRAVIIFTFDDGAVSDYLLAFPILKEYGIKGTSYIITKFTDSNTPGKLTWGQIKKMAEYGWIFGGHTYAHHRMTGMTDKQIKRDCELVNESFTKQGLNPPVITAYPYGAYNKDVIEAIKPFYRQARLAFYRKDFVSLSGNPYKIPSISADMQTIGKLKKAEDIVDKACAESAVIVFRVHALYKNEPCDTVKRNTHILSGCAPQTDSKLFAKLVKYCVDKRCTFITMTQLMSYMERN